MLKEIALNEIKHNAFEMFNKNWSLVTSGNKEDFNTMTVSWGSLGHLWFKDVATVFVRPSRYTYKYMEENEYFTLAVFIDSHKEDLTYLGKNSGRDGDKLSKTKLTPVFLENGVGYEQADYVIVCKKVHSVEFTRDQFCDKDIENVYTDENLHRQYTGIIEKVYKHTV